MAVAVDFGRGMRARSGRKDIEWVSEKVSEWAKFAYVVIGYLQWDRRI